MKSGKRIYRKMSVENIENLLRSSDAPIVMTFSAAWKANSQILDNFYSDLAPRFPQVEFIKIDTDQSEQLMSKFGVREIPTSLFIRQKDILDYFEGVIPKEEVAQRIQRLCDGGDFDLRFVILE